MSDLIDRQDAIDTLLTGKEFLMRALDDVDVVGQDREKYSWGLGLIESCINDIEELPSAEKAQLSGEDATFDCISRQAVLDLPIKRDICWFDGSVDEWINVEDIKELPSAEPRKKGMWIEKQLPTGWKYSICSNCETDLEIKDEHGTFRKLNFSDCKFCPVCGSYNGGEERDDDS